MKREGVGHVAESDDTWRIEIKCAFPGPTATRCCSCLEIFVFCQFEQLFDSGLLFLFSGTRRHLSELKSAEVVVTSLGRARLSATVRLDASCQSQSSLFPFDRIHCSVQLVLDSAATQLTRPPPNVNLIPPVDGRVKSWTSCRYYGRPGTNFDDNEGG